MPSTCSPRLEWRLDAAERAMVRTAQRRVDGRVRLALEIAEAVPVVRAVPVHRQQVPGAAGHLGLDVHDQRRGRIAHDLLARSIDEAADLRQVGIAAGSQSLDQIDDRVEPLVARDEVARLLRERARRQRRDVAADHQHLLRRRRLANRRRHRRRAGHVLRRRRWLMAVDHHRREARRQVGDRAAVCSGESSSASASTISTEYPRCADEAGDQPRPDRILDGRERARRATGRCARGCPG